MFSENKCTTKINVVKIYTAKIYARKNQCTANINVPRKINVPQKYMYTKIYSLHKQIRRISRLYAVQCGI